MNMKRGTLIRCSKCGEINEVIVELKIEERCPYKETSIDSQQLLSHDDKQKGVK